MSTPKDRLYVALFIKEGEPEMPGGEDRYRWALIVGPKNESDEGAEGVRFCIKEMIKTTEGGDRHSTWMFEERLVKACPSHMLLTRVVIGEIEDSSHLQDILKSIPAHQDIPGWNSVEWVKQAIEMVLLDGKALGASAGHWVAIRDTVMSYINIKKATNRFNGKGDFDMSKVATYDMLEGKEEIP
ncbi:hypothetical protein NUW58_g8439 [Xylaria curta]|uniref:Uncharacterized protein n=1 Tax=Xylaria curta TaxID=42375 RepID=A0ACC1N8F1_9PEZI|nr:hypothetical protein NUW58_g8439 [Xylaria curta]